MANQPIWRGSRLIYLQPGYPREVVTANGTRTKFIYSGPYTTLKSSKPKIGQTISGYLGTVEQTEVYPGDAGPDGAGTLEVHLNDESTPSNIITSGGSDTTWEIEWVDIGRSIRQHPRYDGTAAAGNAFNGVRLSTAVVLIEGKQVPLGSLLDEMTGSSISERNALVGKIPAGDSLNLLLDIEKKIKAGTESYIEPAPVLRKTTRSFLAPNTTKMGKRVGKPYSTAPDGYEWLTTADKAIKQGSRGKWEQIEEFTGALSWDVDLYPAT